MKGTIVESRPSGVTVLFENGVSASFPIEQLADGLAMTLKGGSLLDVPVQSIQEINGKMLVELLPEKLTRIDWPDLFEVGSCYRTDTYYPRKGESVADDLAHAGLNGWEMAYLSDGTVRSWGVFESSREGVLAMLVGMLVWGDFTPNMWHDRSRNIAYVFVSERMNVRNGAVAGLWDKAAVILGFNRIVFVISYPEPIFAIGLVEGALGLYTTMALVDHLFRTRTSSTKWGPVAQTDYTRLPEGGWPGNGKERAREMNQLYSWEQHELPSLIAGFLLELYYKGNGLRTFSPNALGDLPVMEINGDLDTALANACVEATKQHVHVREYGIAIHTRTVSGQQQQFVYGYAIVGSNDAVQVEIVDVYEDSLTLRKDGLMVYVVELAMHQFGLGRQKIRLEYPHDLRYKLLAEGLFLKGPFTQQEELDQVWETHTAKA